MLSCREQRGEGILIILDVKGAFDRRFWSKILVRLRKAGMRGRALKLVKDYLFERFVQVVCNGDTSTARAIYSGVPQGARWSPILWDFDISELPGVVSQYAEIGCYADGMWLWYDITDQNRDHIVDIVNLDLQSLLEWADDNRTTFEPDKTAMMVVSGKRSPFVPVGISMGGFEVEHMDSVKATGFVFDSKLTMSSHIDLIARKARQRVAALRNLKPYLNQSNMQTMYECFIRSILEHESVLYMGAAESHLNKLDAIQHAAERVGGFHSQPLRARREAAAICLALKLLDQQCKSGLNRFAPKLTDWESDNYNHSMALRQMEGFQLHPVVLSKYTLDIFKRSFLGSIHIIWDKLPQSLLKIEHESGWRKISTKCKKFFRVL